MENQFSETSLTIREINDRYRTNFNQNIPTLSVMLTSGIADLESTVRNEVLKRMQTFNAFTQDNDPHREHDFAFFKSPLANGNLQKFFFKFDYYDLSLQGHSPDPADETVTCRVLTIGFASDY